MELSSLEGRLLAGRFQLGKLLGQGGYGAVFKAEQVSMGRPCAVKVLAPHLDSSDETVKRFELEARATSRLTHSNTIVVYDFGRDSETGLLFLAMEYLDGDDLDRYVKRYGPMTVQQGLHVLEQMAGSLQDAHDAGLVHRDVKPKNAMVTERGADPMFVKLIDFGISKAFDPIAHQRTSFLELTGTGMVVGTPQYMSPEQLRNDPVDGRSDQYSLAITAYRILTGRTPFQGASLVDVAVKHISDSPLPLRAYRPDLSVPADFEGVLLQALSKDPANRFDSMHAFANALRASVEGVEGPKPPTSREPWADAETGSMPFAVDEIDETENMAGEAIPEHVDPDEAFAPTAGLEAQGDGETPVHLGGTLARNRGEQNDVNTDDVPGSTLVVLREESGQSDRADAANDISQVDGEAGDAVGGAEPRQVTGEVPVESPSGEWKLGDVAVDRPPEAKDTNRRAVLGTIAFLAVVGAIVAVSVGVLRGVESGGESSIAQGETTVDTSGVEKGATAGGGTAIDAEDVVPRPGDIAAKSTSPTFELGEGDEEETVSESTTKASTNRETDSAASLSPDSLSEDSLAEDLPADPQPVESEPASKAPEKSKSTDPSKDEEQDTDKPEPTKKEDTAADETPPPPGTVKVVLIPWGDLYVDGKSRGDATRQSLRLAPGTYRLELRQDGETRDDKRVRVKSGKSVNVTLRAK